MGNAAGGNANRLAHETSPYLRQHAHNPVDWYPWGEQALALARESGKPILLSIGYAACHWCHVMAHESFEDPATAALMNEHFVNIKVDREERPDIDRLYQLSQQLLSGRGGGWPLTVFLMHDDQRPFFAGTYFPPQRRHGMPAFSELLLHVASYYREHREELRHSASAVVAALEDMNPAPVAAGVTLDAERNIVSYGFAPFALSEADTARVHGNDERIPVKAYTDGVRLLWEVVYNFSRAE